MSSLHLYEMGTLPPGHAFLRKARRQLWYVLMKEIVRSLMLSGGRSQLVLRRDFSLKQDEMD